MLESNKITLIWGYLVAFKAIYDQYKYQVPRCQGYTGFGLHFQFSLYLLKYLRDTNPARPPKCPEAWLASPRGSGRNLFMAYWNFFALPAAIFKIQ